MLIEKAIKYLIRAEGRRYHIGKVALPKPRPVSMRGVLPTSSQRVD